MNTLLNNWNIVRAFKLALGIMMVAQAFSWQSVLIGIGGGILMVLALLNIGCFGGSCSADPAKDRKTLNKKVDVNCKQAGL